MFSFSYRLDWHQQVSCLEWVGFFSALGWLDADLICSSPATFGYLTLGCRIFLVGADSLGAGWVGRKRAGQISWDWLPPGV